MSDVRECLVFIVLIEREHFLVDVGDKEVFPASPVQVDSVNAMPERACPLSLKPSPEASATSSHSFKPIRKKEILNGVVGNE